ncbi:MAG TPA: hypothetical protein EYH34_19085 [Planctomycetes bacterium]|nr:hypothetical protein [Planctomycetota bacterium]
MPEIAVAVPHQLDQAEATRRLQHGAGVLKNTFSGHFSDLEENWDGDAVQFAFKTFGMNVQGKVTSEPSQVTVNLTLPLVAMMFKGKIEEQIREQLGKILA